MRSDQRVLGRPPLLRLILVAWWAFWVGLSILSGTREGPWFDHHDQFHFPTWAVMRSVLLVTLYTVLVAVTLLRFRWSMVLRVGLAVVIAIGCVLLDPAFGWTDLEPAEYGSVVYAFLLSMVLFLMLAALMIREGLVRLRRLVPQ